ncbi:hypothetical protein, partial [Staphylococcus aureus]
GPRRVSLDSSVSPFSTWDPRIPGAPVGGARQLFVHSSVDPGHLPSSDADIAFAPVTHLAGWIARKQLTSERLTRLYLKRLERY